MSTSLFISCLKPPVEVYLSDYRINIDDYTSKFLQAFPFSKIERPLAITNSTYLLYWSLNDENKTGVSGGIQSDSITTSFSGGYWNTKDYILWHRRYIPDSVPLYLFDDNLRFIYLLTLETTKADLINLMGAFEGE